MTATLLPIPMMLHPSSASLRPKAFRLCTSGRMVLVTILLAHLVVEASHADAQRGRRRPPAAPEVVEAPGDASLRAAQAAFAAGDFVSAERLYNQSFAESQNAVVLVGLADALERQGNAVGAVDALTRYLDLRADAPDRVAVEERLTTLRALRGVVLVSAEPPGEVWLDGERTGYVTPVELTLPPGRHGLAVTVRGEIVTEHAIDVPFGGRTSLTLVEGQVSDTAPGAETATESDAGVDSAPDPAAESAPQAEASVEPGSGTLSGDGVPIEEPEAPHDDVPVSTYVPRRAAAISAGVAAGTVVVGTVLGFMALTEQSDFDARPSDAAADRGERLALFSDVMFGVAGIAAVTSIVLYVTDRRAARRAEEDSATQVRLVPLAVRRGAGVGASLQF